MANFSESQFLLQQLRDGDILWELQASSGRRPTTLCFPRDQSGGGVRCALVR